MSTILNPAATEPEVTAEEVSNRLLFEHQDELYDVVAACLKAHAPSLGPDKIAVLGPMFRDVSERSFKIGLRAAAQAMGANQAPLVEPADI